MIDNNLNNIVLHYIILYYISRPDDDIYVWT
jgi:hypothetical protein